jgi:diaminopimelate epimerase
VRFSKWHALGNSYLLVERGDLGQPLDSERARRLCDVRYGIGSDGVLEVVAADGAQAEIAIWNPDGSVAEFSGNGSRIAAAWLARRAGVAQVTVAVAGRSYPAAIRDDGTIAMGVGDVEVGKIETVELGEERVELTPVSVGNPHAVVRRDPVREELLRLGPQLEVHARFPERTNVQLVRADGRNELTVLVWERGAGETSASGSSAVAAAAAAVVNGWCESPVTVRMPGGSLRVELDEQNRVTLVGPAEEICAGELRDHSS